MRAIMTELLLRGPQTAGELRARCARLYAFENQEAVGAVIGALAALDPPALGPLPRCAGQSAVRYAHCYYKEHERAALGAEPAPVQAGTIEGRAQAGPTEAAAGGASGEVAGLQTQVENLGAELAELHEAVGELRRRLEAIESQLR